MLVMGSTVDEDRVIDFGEVVIVGQVPERDDPKPHLEPSGEAPAKPSETSFSRSSWVPFAIAGGLVVAGGAALVWRKRR